MQNKLWTKDFTTITLGSVVSMMGNSIAGFAMSLFVLDYMDSTLLYAIYIFLYTLPQIAAPIISCVCVVSLLLSRIFLKEKLTKKQYIFITTIIIGVVMLGILEGE